MEQMSDALRTILSSRILAGDAPKILREEWPFAFMECQVCGAEFSRKVWLLKLPKRGRCCSRSCGRKLAWQEMAPETVAAIREQVAAAKRGRPSWNAGREWPADHRERMSAAAKTSGQTFSVRGGNGKGMTKHEMMLLPVLAPGWIWNHPIRTGSKERGVATNYKVDFGWPGKKIALEVDGGSHRDRRLLDWKKEAVLCSLGWCLLRLTNEQVERMFST